MKCKECGGKMELRSLEGKWRVKGVPYELVVKDNKSSVTFEFWEGTKRRKFQRIDIPICKIEHLITFLTLVLTK